MNYLFDLTELEFRLIQDFIDETFGIILKDERRTFVKMKLYPRVMALGFTSFGEYLQFIKYGTESGREISQMISLLTNTETYFFREVPQLNIFRDFILPEIRERRLARNEKRIRLLSAGCSSGEEVYTLAMLVFNTGQFFWGWEIKIIGMDINENALETARKGIYYERSFRMTDPEYIKKFFSANSGDFTAKEVIRRMTAFVHGNITLPLAMDDLDVIFCRNVLIYFSDDKVKKAIQHFMGALSPGGYLFLGHSETLTGIFNDFEARRFPETIIYQKREY